MGQTRPEPAAPQPPLQADGRSPTAHVHQPTETTADPQLPQYRNWGTARRAAAFSRQLPAAAAHQAAQRSDILASKVRETRVAMLRPPTTAHARSPANATTRPRPPPDLPNTDGCRPMTDSSDVTSFGGTRADGLRPTPAAAALEWSATMAPAKYAVLPPATAAPTPHHWPRPLHEPTSWPRDHQGPFSSTGCVTRAWNGITGGTLTTTEVVQMLNPSAEGGPTPMATRGTNGDGLYLKWQDALEWYFGDAYTVLNVPASCGRKLLTSDAFHGAVNMHHGTFRGPGGSGHVDHVSRNDIQHHPHLTADTGPALTAVFHSERLGRVLLTAAGLHISEADTDDRVLAPMQHVINAFTARQRTPTDSSYVSTIAELATRFSETRRRHGAGGDWFATGVFYDDFMYAALAFFSPAVHLVQSLVFGATGTDMADGTQYPASGAMRKNKQTIAVPRAALSVLGLRLRTVPNPGMIFPPDKRTSVSRDGRDIIAAAVHKVRAAWTTRRRQYDQGRADHALRERLGRCTAKQIQKGNSNAARHLREARQALTPLAGGPQTHRWISQVEHLGRADAALLRAANLLRSQLGRNYHNKPVLKLPKNALTTMTYIIDRVAKGSGFRHGFPARSLPNLLPDSEHLHLNPRPPPPPPPAATGETDSRMPDTCPYPPDEPAGPVDPGFETWIISGDAARRPDDVSQRRTTDDPCGWGFYIWRYGTATVFHCQGRWRENEMRDIDITGLEGLTTGFAIEVLKWLRGNQLSKRLDIYHFGDNKSDAEFILNNGGGKGDCSRYLGAHRAEALKDTLWRILSYHQNRRHNTPGDFLSNAKVPEFCADIRGHFNAVGLEPTIVDLGPLPNVIRNTNGLLRHLSQTSPINDDGTLDELSFLDSIVADITAAAAAVGSDNWTAPTTITARPATTTGGHQAAADARQERSQRPRDDSWRRGVPISIGQQDPEILCANLGTMTPEQMRHAASTSGFLWDVYSKSDPRRSPYRVWGPDDRSMCQRPFLLPREPPAPEGRRGIWSNVPADEAERFVAPDVIMCEPPSTGTGTFDSHMHLRGAQLLDDLITRSVAEVQRVTTLARQQSRLGAWSGSAPLRAEPFVTQIRAAGLLADTPPPLLDDTDSWRAWSHRFRRTLLRACEAVADTTRRCLDSLPAVSLFNLFHHQTDLHMVIGWVSDYDCAIRRFAEEAAASDQPRTVKFDYDSVRTNRPPSAASTEEGRARPPRPATGHDGVFIDSTRIANSGTLNYFTGPAWTVNADGTLDVDINLRLHPVLFENPQHFTELKLAAIFEDAAACASVHMPPPDFDHMFDIVFTGFSNYSTADNHIILVPPYSSFFRNWAFIQRKNAQKMGQFAVPRLGPCRRGLLTIPVVLSSRGCVDDQTDDEGNIKERQTIDPALHAVGQFGTEWDPGTDPSLNANTFPVEDERIPTIDFFKLEMLSRQLCIMDLAHLPIVLAKKDAAGYYEQFGRSTQMFHQQVQWVSPDGMQFDTRLVFGFCAEPFTTQRWSFQLNWRTAQLLRREQAAWEHCWAGLTTFGLGGPQPPPTATAPNRPRTPTAD